MLTFEVIINPIILLVAMIGAGMVGFVLGRKKVAKSQRQIIHLENEMMSSHAEILEMQKAYVKMESRLRELSIPVIPMKINGKDASKEQATK